MTDARQLAAMLEMSRFKENHDAAAMLREQAAELTRLRAALAAAQPDHIPDVGEKVAQPVPATGAQPAFYVRLHPDGTLTDELLPAGLIEHVRKVSGAWVPLYVGAPPQAAAHTGSAAE